MLQYALVSIALQCEPASLAPLDVSLASSIDDVGLKKEKGFFETCVIEYQNGGALSWVSQIGRRAHRMPAVRMYAHVVPFRNASNETLRRAVVQTASVAFDPARTVEKLGDYAAKAAAQGAKLVVFTEAFVGGYPKGLDFGARVGSRSAAGREAFRLYYDGAIEVPGAQAERIGEIAAANAVYLVTGIIERDRGTLYCTVLHHAPDARCLARS